MSISKKKSDYIKDCFIENLNFKKDKRGYFLNVLTEKLLCNVPLKKIKQINVSKNKKKGTIRGLHLQEKPYTEDKFIFCIKGKILDVVVDLRKKSKTYGKYITFPLSEKNPKILFVPKNCAHGYQTLTDDTLILYFHTNIYSPKYESGITPEDKTLGIDWPIAKKIISDKDKKLKSFIDYEM